MWLVPRWLASSILRDGFRRTARRLPRIELPALFLAAPLLLGGLLPGEPTTLERWPWAGAWRYPLGTGEDLFERREDGVPRYQLLRGLARGTAARRGTADSIPHRGHQGADIGNRSGGDVVRAPAHGVVVRASGSGENSGYGSLVVLAHRTPEGQLYYSIHAHLRPGSVRVTAGRRVAAGDSLGRVGHSGRAWNDHLHFEVRRADSPGLRWEKATPVDPLQFISKRRPAARKDSSWAGPYLAWAEMGALLPDDVRSDEPLTRERWIGMLARSARLPDLALPQGHPALRERLIHERLLPDDAAAAATTPLGWSEVARDLERLRDLGTCLVRPPIGAEVHRASCERRFGTREPSRKPREVVRALRGKPTLAEGCLLLADLRLREVPRERIASAAH
jgi:hypothetical protein